MLGLVGSPFAAIGAERIGQMRFLPAKRFLLLARVTLGRGTDPATRGHDLEHGMFGRTAPLPPVKSDSVAPLWRPVSC
jgi:hypothetical protein